MIPLKLNVKWKEKDSLRNQLMQSCKSEQVIPTVFSNAVGLQHVLCSVWLCSYIVKKKWKVVLPEEMHKSLSTTATKVYKRNGSKKLQLQSIELHIIHNMQQRVVQTKVVM